MGTLRRVGRLNRRVELLHQVVALDTLGRQNRTTPWTVAAELWAEVREINGTELERANQMSVTGSHIVTIRFRAGVSAANRVRFRGRVFEVRAVLDADSSQRELQLVCGESK
jgi:SPP1 family predicted phage head-tail adaptor